MELFKLFGTIAINNNEANTAIDDTTGKAQKSEPKITSAFKKIGTAVLTYFGTKTIINFGKAITDTTASFEDGMLKVQSLTGATSEEYDKLSQAALNYGSTTAWTSKDVADAMGYMALAGFNTNEILESTSGMLSLASASGEDLATVTDILTDSMTGFGDGADQASRYADVLATTQAKSNTTVGDLGEAFTYVSSLAGTYKYSLEDVSAALGDMANAGVKGSMAGTSLSSIITRLGTNTNGARDAVEALGVQFYSQDGTARNLGDVIADLCDATSGMDTAQKAELASTVAGAEAQKGLLAILNQGSDAYNGLKDQLYNCSGAANSMATNMESGLGGAIRNMSSAWEGFKISLGEKFEKPLGNAIRKGASWLSGTATPAVVTFVTDAINNFSTLKSNAQPSVDNLRESFENLQQAFQPVVDAVQPLINKFNEYVTSGNAVNDASTLVNTAIDLFANGVDFAAGAVSSLIDFVSGIVEGFQSMEQWCSKNSTAVDLLAVAVGTITALIIAANASQIAMNGAIAISNGLITAASVIQGIQNAATVVWTTVSTAATAATTALGAAFTFLTSPISLVIIAIGAVIAIGVLLYKNWDTIKEKAGVLGAKLSEKWNNIKEKTHETFENVKNTMSNAMSTAKDYVFGKLDAIKQKYDENGGGLKGIAAGTMEAIKHYYSIGYDAINTITGGKLDEIKNKITEKMDAAKDKVKDIVDKIKGFFDFEAKIPKIKMPHFSVKPEGWKIDDLLEGKIPSLGIEWYAKAMDNPMLMTKPTAFGIRNGKVMAGGEAGSEVVSGTDTLMGMISEAVAQQNNGLVNVLLKILDAILTMDEDMGGNLREALEGTALRVNDREFARLVKAVD